MASMNVEPQPGPSGLSVLFPDQYAWYVFAASLDVMFTVVLLMHLGAREVNAIAQRAIDLFGTWGLIGLKFASVVLVVAICEYVGRRSPRAGRRLATAAVIITMFPVAASVAQAAWFYAEGSLMATVTMAGELDAAGE